MKNAEKTLDALSECVRCCILDAKRTEGVQREEKTDLVTNGIYSVSRNPAFLGFDLMYIGILCSFFNWYLLVITVLALVLFHLQIVKVEEEFLTETFGKEYIAYKKKVFRYFGRKF